MNKYISGAIGVEIPLQDGVFKYNLPEVRYLRNKRVKHIDFCFYSELEKAFSGQDIYQLDKGIFLTLRENNTQEEKIAKLPVNELNSSGNRLFINKIIDLEKSYIELTGSLSNLTNKSFYLVFWYDEPNNRELIPSNCKTTIESFSIKLSGSTNYFADYRHLMGKRYQNIFVSLPTLLPDSTTSIDSTDLKSIFITLTKGTEEYFSNIPLYFFYQANQNFKLRLQNISFDFEKSYVTDRGNSGKSVFFNAIIDDNK